VGTGVNSSPHGGFISLPARDPIQSDRRAASRLKAVLKRIVCLAVGVTDLRALPKDIRRREVDDHWISLAAAQASFQGFDLLGTTLKRSSERVKPSQSRREMEKPAAVVHFQKVRLALPSDPPQVMTK
jgi:hypothetical protein